MCPTSGSCDTVLTSSYAELFGLPLPLFGLAAYAAVAVLAFAAGRQAAAGGAPPLQRQLVSLALAGGVTALATTSSFLV